MPTEGANVISLNDLHINYLSLLLISLWPRPSHVLSLNICWQSGYARAVVALHITKRLARKEEANDLTSKHLLPK